MLAFNCFILFGLFVQLVSSDVSLTIGSNHQNQNARTEQTVRSNYEAPRGYEYSGSYSTVAPENKAQYVGSYSTVAPENKAQYVGSYSTVAPGNKAQYVGSYSTANKAQYVNIYPSGVPETKIEYVGSYSTVAPESKAQYVGSYSSVAPENKGQYVGSYSTVAPGNKAQYVGSYSTVAPGNKAQYVGSYSTVAPENNGQYVGSYSTVAPGNKAQYVGSYSTVAPANKAQYVGSYSTVAPDNKAQYVGSYSTVAPGNKAQYVGSYSTVAPENKGQYVGSYSTVAPGNKAQYVGSYSTVAPDNKAQYVASYSTVAPGNKAQYVGSYSTVAPENKGQYVGSYSTVAPGNKAQYVGSYSTVAPENKGQYVGSYSTVAPDNKAQYVGSYSTVAPGNKAQYVGSYSTVAPDNKAQYVVSSSSKSSYDSYPSGQVSDRKYYSAKQQEYNPQYQNDRGVTLISKELQVPFVVSQKNDDSDDCDESKDSKVNQQVQVEENVSDNQSDEKNVAFAESDETVKPVYKVSKYEVRRPGIEKKFYDIEEKVFIKPAGSAIFELEHDKAHSSAIINKHFNQKQSYPYPQQQAYPYPQQQAYPYPQQQAYPYPQEQSYPYPQYADDDSGYYSQDQQYANHGYHPVIHSVPSPGYDYNPVFHHSPPRTHVTYPNTFNYKPVYTPTTVTPGYIPPVTGGYLPPCEETPTPKPHSKPSYPQLELSEEFDDNDEHDEHDDHDYDADAAFIHPINEENQEVVDIRYTPNKSNANRDREDYRVQPSSVYNPDSRIDRVRFEYQNQRGDLAQLKLNQYPQQFHQEYVPPNVNVNQKQVQIRPNGDAPAKYTQDKGQTSPLEVENSQRLLDLYSANGDVTEIGFGGNGKSQRYQSPSTSSNVRSRVVSVTPAPQFANYVDEQHKSHRVALSKPLYTIQQVEVHEHNHRLVEDVQSDSVEPKVSEFAKLKLIGSSHGKTASQRQAEFKQEVEYVTPVPQEYGHLRAGSPVPDTLQK